ncbi:hypothetical protein [Synechococcus sp. A15-24]|uniref:hypothetical protein n=1 Tax=Synechococcus sp. A15-24 TaxID=1050635 RepID=UPI00164633E3|nr:hypothetical protein [Synechococcus sp. A15-24]
MAITTRAQRQQRQNEALQLISSAKPATKPAGKGPRGKSIAAQCISAIYALKPPGHDLPLRQLNQPLKQNAL